MAVNKVIYDQTTLIDLTGDDITADVLKSGVKAHNCAGVQITGTAQCFPLEPEVYDHNIGYINNGSWIYENPTNTYIDIYEAEADNGYLIALGGTVGTRFRCMFTTEDITTKTSGKVTGTNITNQNDPRTHAYTTVRPESDGYILVAKDNIGHSGLLSYVFNITKSCD